MVKSKGKKKNKYCPRYKVLHQREKNKARKLAKHLKRFPDDAIAQKAYTIVKVF